MANLSARHPRFAPVLAGAISVVLAPMPALAGTMPQLDFANPLTISQVVWGAIIFAVLYLAFSWFALPRVGRVLENRAQSIAADLETAKAAKQAADEAAATADTARRTAAAQGQAAVAAASEAAKTAAAAESARLNAALDVQLAESEQRITAARAAAMGALAEVAAETASTLIGRLTGKRASPQHLAGAVANAMAARGIQA